MISPCPLPLSGPPPDRKACDEARRELLELGGAETLRARRYGRQLGLVIVQLDRRDGTEEGVAYEVAQAVVRTGADRVLRLGDGRFAALLPETTLSGAIHLAARLQQGLNAAQLPARVGFAALDRDDSRFPDMLARARAMVERPA